jgi:hypothetical protein
MAIENTSFENIENKLMLILLAKPNETFTKSELYNLLLDKLEITNHYVNPEFKFKYMIVLRQLPSKYDVKVTNNLVTAGSEVNIEFKETVCLDLPSMEDLSEYIVENNLLKTANFAELPFNLVHGNKLLTVEKLFNQESFNYFKKYNTENETPIKYINSHRMSNIFLEKIYLKVIFLEQENAELTKKILKIEEKNNNLTLSEFLIRQLQKYLIKHDKDIRDIFNIGCGIFFLMMSEKTIKLILLLNVVFCFVDFIYSKFFSK